MALCFSTNFCLFVELTLILLLFTLISDFGYVSCNQDFEFVDKDSLLRGESSLTTFERRAELLATSDDSCWKSAVDDLKSDCKSMSEGDQRLMALRFANCHFEKSGLKTFPCSADNFLICTRDMAMESHLAFSTYTEFFGKVIDICHYLKSDLWMERTKQVIGKLSKTSADVVDRLDISAEKQDQLLSIQHLSIENQEKILKSGQEIQDSVEASAKTAKKEFADAKLRAAEKSKWLDASFDKVHSYLNRITSLFDSLFNHFTVIQCAIFYMFSLFFWMFACSSPSTSHARFIVCTALLLCCIVEVLFTSFYGLSDQLWIDASIWKMRALSYTICFLSCGYYWMSFRKHVMPSHSEWKQNKDYLHMLSGQLKLLHQRLDSKKMDVSVVQGHWLPGDDSTSPYLDYVDRGHDIVSTGPQSSLTRIKPMSFSTPKKGTEQKPRKKYEDSGVGEDVLGISRENLMDLSRSQTKKRTPSLIKAKRESLVQSPKSEEADQSRNLSSHSYNLRSRKSLATLSSD